MKVLQISKYGNLAEVAKPVDIREPDAPRADELSVAGVGAPNADSSPVPC
jgi:hypothetical protein